MAPASVHWEVGNAFSAMLKRYRITVEQARRAIEVYKSIPVRLIDVDLGHAVELAARLKIYAYDAYLLAAAQRTGAPLLTLDYGLRLAATSAGVDVLEVAP